MSINLPYPTTLKDYLCWKVEMPPPCDLAHHVNMMSLAVETIPNICATGQTSRRQIMTKRSKSLRGLQQQPLEIPLHPVQNEYSTAMVVYPVIRHMK